MTLNEVMTALAAKGSESTKRIFARHGAKEPFFGVKIADLKTIHKKIKGDQELALKLYATGNGDAQYLAGIVADGRKMTAAQLQRWVETASWPMIADTTVPWVTTEHPEAFKLARMWIDSPNESIASTGWSTLGGLAATIPDGKLPIEEFSSLLERVGKTLSAAPNRVRRAMNNFVISCGTYAAPLAQKAMATARKLGRIKVDVGDTACQVPDAESYIIKCRRGAAVAPKRKTMRC